MILLQTLGTFGLIIAIIIYVIVTLYQSSQYNSTSLKAYEIFHRFFIVVGGILIGVGVGFLQIPFAQVNILADEFILGLMSISAGILFVIVGSLYLRNSLWRPLENISEYSAEFGTNFIATRLPETGGKELERFATRFNQNIITLANDISKLEMYSERLSEDVESTISDGKDLTEITSSLSDLAIQYGDNTQNQSSVVREIENEIDSFTNWYDEIQQNLTENFTELRSISEMGNLIAINAAVEASNLETPNPGFDTLASKLRDLARSLEERQENLRRLLDQINLNYREFKSAVERQIVDAVDISNSTSNLGDRVDDLISEIANREVVFIDSYNQLKRSLNNLNDNIPTAYAE